VRSSCHGGLFGVPGVKADQVDRHGGQHVLEECLRLAAVTSLVNAAASGGLCDKAFHLTTQRVALLPLCGGLFGA